MTKQSSPHTNQEQTIMETKTAIDADMKIGDIISRYPETKDHFILHGFDAVVSEDGLRALAPFLSLKTALRARFMNLAQFIEGLETAIAQNTDEETPGLTDYAGQGNLTLLALMPCGLKMAFAKALNPFMQEYNTNSASSVKYAIEGNLNQELSYYPYVDRLESGDELPDIIISSDFNTFYGKRFREKFVSTEIFTGYDQPPFNPAYKTAGIIEPRGDYSVITVNPLVMIVNKDQLKGRPLPTCWDDLLDPVWEKSIVLRGGNGFFCHAVLLPVYKKHGPEGLKKLAKNVCLGMHPSQMVKRIDSNGEGAIYVMPEFFAKRIKNTLRYQIVWPKDGALASPVTLQAKREKLTELKPILDFLTGTELSQTLANVGFPVARNDIDGEAQKKPLLWLGWDYLYDHDLPSLNSDIDAVFMPELELMPNG